VVLALVSGFLHDYAKIPTQVKIKIVEHECTEPRCNGIVMIGQSRPARKMPSEKQKPWHASSASLRHVRKEVFYSSGLREFQQSTGRVADIFERVRHPSRGEQ
jgi:hypothetical protein